MIMICNLYYGLLRARIPHNCHAHKLILKNSCTVYPFSSFPIIHLFGTFIEQAYLTHPSLDFYYYIHVLTNSTFYNPNVVNIVR